MVGVGYLNEGFAILKHPVYMPNTHCFDGISQTDTFTVTKINEPKL